MVSETHTLLVSDGEFLTDTMNGIRVSSEEVYPEVHQAGLSNADPVQWAIQETDGKISFDPTAAAKPRLPRPKVRSY